MPKQLITHRLEANVLGPPERKMKPIRLQAGLASPELATAEIVSLRPERRIEKPELLPDPDLKGPRSKQPSFLSLQCPFRQALAGSLHVAAVNAPCAPPFFFFLEYDTTLFFISN